MGARGRGIAAEIPGRVTAQPRSALQLKLFKGTVSALGPTETLTFTLDKLKKIDKAAQARKETQQGVNVILPELAPDQQDDPVWKLGQPLEYPSHAPKVEHFA